MLEEQKNEKIYSILENNSVHEGEEDSEEDTETEVDLDTETESEEEIVESRKSCGLIQSPSWFRGRAPISPSSMTKISKKRIKFNESVEIYLFPRCLGGSSIPMSGIPLGMIMKHNGHKKSLLIDSKIHTRDFQFDSNQRRELLTKEGVNLEAEFDLIEEIETIRESRRYLPVCSCGSNGKCGTDKWSCYCTYNELECHEWCVCKKSCSYTQNIPKLDSTNKSDCSEHTHSHSHSHSHSLIEPSSLPILQTERVVKKTIPSVNLFGFLGRVQSSGSRMIHAVNGLIFVWLFVNSVQTVAASMTSN